MKKVQFRALFVRTVRPLACVTIATVTLLASMPGTATAFVAEGSYPTASTGLDTCAYYQTPNRLYYQIEAPLDNMLNWGGNGRYPIWWADQFWATQGLDGALRLWNDDTANTRCFAQIFLTTISAGPGYLAETVQGGPNTVCESMQAGYPCEIDVNTYYRAAFNYTNAQSTLCDGTRNACSLYQTVAHEMGHWIGLGHSGINYNPNVWPYACDPAPGCRFQPADDPYAHSVMQTNEDFFQGAPSCDDIQGFLQARFNYYYNALANPSFEYGGGPGNPGACWKYLPSGAGGSATDYNQPSLAQSYSWFVQFNGNGAAGSSILQDMWLNGPQTTFQHVRFWLRDRDPSTWVPVSIVVWSIPVGGSASVLGSINYSVPPDSTWHYYNLFNVTVPQNSPIRVQIYNNSSLNLDVDSGELGPQGP